MSGYTIIHNKAENKFAVKETKTKQIIRIADDKQQAQLFRSFVEGGGAFCGFTPHFITVSTGQK